MTRVANIYQLQNVSLLDLWQLLCCIIKWCFYVFCIHLIFVDELNKVFCKVFNVLHKEMKKILKSQKKKKKKTVADLLTTLTTLSMSEGYDTDKMLTFPRIHSHICTRSNNHNNNIFRVDKTQCCWCRGVGEEVCVWGSAFGTRFLVRDLSAPAHKVCSSVLQCTTWHTDLTFPLKMSTVMIAAFYLSAL